MCESTATASPPSAIVPHDAGADRRRPHRARRWRPGFIDIHTHYDAQVLWDGALSPSCWHGVTTVVAGKLRLRRRTCCPSTVRLVARILEMVEDMAAEALRAGVELGLRDVPRVSRRRSSGAQAPERRGVRRAHTVAGRGDGRRCVRPCGHRKRTRPHVRARARSAAGGSDRACEFAGGPTTSAPAEVRHRASSAGSTS